MGTIGSLELCSTLMGTIGSSEHCSTSMGTIGYSEPRSTLVGTIGSLERCSTSMGTIGYSEPRSTLVGTIGSLERCSTSMGTIGYSELCSTSMGTTSCSISLSSKYSYYNYSEFFAVKNMYRCGNTKKPIFSMLHTWSILTLEYDMVKGVDPPCQDILVTYRYGHIALTHYDIIYCCFLKRRSPHQICSIIKLIMNRNLMRRHDFHVYMTIMVYNPIANNMIILAAFVSCDFSSPFSGFCIFNSTSVPNFEGHTLIGGGRGKQPPFTFAELQGN